jgi:hypothetical protein
MRSSDRLNWSNSRFDLSYSRFDLSYKAIKICYTTTLSIMLRTIDPADSWRGKLKIRVERSPRSRSFLKNSDFCTHRRANPIALANHLAILKSFARIEALTWEQDMPPKAEDTEFALPIHRLNYNQSTAQYLLSPAQLVHLYQPQSHQASANLALSDRRQIV